MSKASLGIIALVCGIYVVMPDPLPIVADDVIVGLLGAASVLKYVKEGKTNTPKLPK